MDVTGSCHLEIGGDFGQMFDNANHSTCVVSVRDASLPLKDLSSARFIKPLMVIAGPTQPQSMQMFFRNVVDFFKVRGPQSDHPLRMKTAGGEDVALRFWLVRPALGHPVTHPSDRRWPIGLVIAAFWAAFVACWRVCMSMARNASGVMLSR
eukprot:275002-Chlamydomonas_euryale.AAC.1